jgi:hypothetical protein
MNATRLRRFSLPLVLLAGLLTGCGQRTLSQDTTYPVNGTLRLHGQPAAFVIVHLQPVDQGKGAEAVGITNQEGAFQLRTYSNDNFDGAVPGEYKVVLESYDPVQGAFGGIKPPPDVKPTDIPGAELDTGMTVQITSGDNAPEVDVP